MLKFKKLSRDEMQKLKGGSDGTCTVSVACYGSTTTVSCSGSASKCYHEDSVNLQTGWVQCDSDPKVSC
jgi:hypothetical protein